MSCSLPSRVYINPSSLRTDCPSATGCPCTNASTFGFTAPQEDAGCPLTAPLGVTQALARVRSVFNGPSGAPTRAQADQAVDCGECLLSVPLNVHDAALIDRIYMSQGATTGVTGGTIVFRLCGSDCDSSCLVRESDTTASVLVFGNVLTDLQLTYASDVDASLGTAAAITANSNTIFSA